MWQNDIRLLQQDRQIWSFAGNTSTVLEGHMRILTLLFSGLHLTQVPEEAPVYIDDQMRRILKFPLYLITDWDDFESLLRIAFKNVAVSKNLRSANMLFRIQSGSWISPRQRVFMPGKKILMNMIFELQHQVDSCPRCPATTTKNDGVETKCEECGLPFSKGKITELLGRNNVAELSSSLSLFDTKYS
jgi:ribosomal protein L37AE/L43A